MTDNTTDQLRPVTVNELRDRTGVHRNTIIRDIESGTLPAEKVGGQWMITPAIADQYAEARDLVSRGEAALAGLRMWAQERGTPRDRRAR